MARASKGDGTDLGFTRDRHIMCPSRLKPTWVADHPSRAFASLRPPQDDGDRPMAVATVSMRPGFAALEGEVVGIGDGAARRRLRLHHLIGDAVALAIGNSLRGIVEPQLHLLAHV